MENNVLQIETTINATIEQVWDAWVKPEHIVNWNFANEDWHCPKSRNDLRKDGKFVATMAAKDGSMSFEFGGTYIEVISHQFIKSVLDDGRNLTVSFIEENGNVKLMEEFEAEPTNSAEIQKAGWQAILDNFKKYVESIS